MKLQRTQPKQKAPAAALQAKIKPSGEPERAKEDSTAGALFAAGGSDVDQPTPAELSHLAVALAQANQTQVTLENREKLLRDAYDFWQQARQIIQTRRTPEPLTGAEVVEALFGNNTITFAEIVEGKLLPKCVGEKGNGEFITSLGGARKAFRSFYRNVVDEKTRWSFFLFQDNPLGIQGDPVTIILNGGTMSKTVFAAFLTWKRVQCGLEPSLEDRLAVERRKATQAQTHDFKSSPATPHQ